MVGCRVCPRKSPAGVCISVQVQPPLAQILVGIRIGVLGVLWVGVPGVFPEIIGDGVYLRPGLAPARSDTYLY